MIAAQSRPQIPIEDLLTGKGKLMQQKLQERERKQELRAQQLSEISKVNHRSEQLVQERYIQQGETVKDRLAKQIGNVKARVLQDIEQPTFKPTISAASIEMAAAATGTHFYAPDYTESNNATDLRRFNAMFADQESSYSNSAHEFEDSNDGPVLYEDFVRNKTSYNSRGNPAAQSTLYNPAYHSLTQQNNGSNPAQAIYSKSQRWNEMRETKLEKERKERERRELQECSFRPNIVTTALSSRNAAGADAGVSYVERQSTWVERRYVYILT